jgi:hypothetical protein
MSNQPVRQTNLLHGSDWQKIYEAFNTINFQASDFSTYREVMVDYLRVNFPEDFDDWIENSEFVMLMDLLAYLGENLAYKTDLNTIDNFIDTSERRESILRLAEMVSYNPARNLPANGLAKITEIETTQDIRDSNGDSLQGVTIRWNDETNEDWFEQWTSIINAALSSSNPVGTPVKLGTVNSILTYLYQTNSVTFRNVVYPFSASVNGGNVNFEVVNPDFEDEGTIKEREPNPANPFHLLYRNDGTGNSSIDTGYFVYFKQGTLSSSDYGFTVPAENRVTEINIDNINNTDVWAQEINEITGSVRQSWTKVDNTENIYYNSLSKTVRSIFQVQTKDNDQINVRWPDGRFGDVPFGTFRLWHRVSNGLTYQINTRDIRNIQISIPYTRNTGTTDEEFILTLRFSLQVPVTNSTPRETTEQIRQRAPQKFYTSNRMVTGEDYQIYPLLAGNLLRKTKSVNRTFSGHSRYIDLNDPTGKHQNTNVFADDGMLYRNTYTVNDIENLPSSKSLSEIVSSRLTPLLNKIDLQNFYYKNFPTYTWVVSSVRVKWQQATSQAFSSTGKFVDSTTSDSPLAIGSTGSGNAAYVREGTLLRFVNTAAGVQGDSGYEEKWAKIESINGTGIVDLSTGAGPVVLNEAVEDGWFVDLFYTSFRTSLSSTELTNIIEEMGELNTFALRYTQSTDTWNIILENNIDSVSDWSTAFAGDTSEQNKDASWLIRVDYSASKWSFTVRCLEYIWESMDAVRFYFTTTRKVNDIETGYPVKDFIRVLRINENAAASGTLMHEYNWNMSEPITYVDGFVEPRRVRLAFLDSDDDGVPDNPREYEEIVEPVSSPTVSSNRFVFFRKGLSTDGYEFYRPMITENGFTFTVVQNLAAISTTLSVKGDVFYAIDENQFREWNGTSLITPSASDYYWREGRKDLLFQWRHYADKRTRIDPAPSNIMDVYLLTEEYWQRIETWKNTTGATIATFPEPPTTNELAITFGSLEKYKSASDSIVWHSANFKVLFGDGASDALRASFNVTKVAGTTVSDNEVKQRVVNAIDEFFDVDNWDFGESFYFTELAAYIHQQNPTVVAQVTIIPTVTSSKFGNLFQIRSEHDELFLSTASVNDVVIINNMTTTNSKIGV